MISIKSWGYLVQKLFWTEATSVSLQRPSILSCMWPRVLVVLYLRQVTSPAGDMKFPAHLFNVSAHLMGEQDKLLISEDLVSDDQYV